MILRSPLPLPLSLLKEDEMESSAESDNVVHFLGRCAQVRACASLELALECGLYCAKESHYLWAA